MCHIVVALRKPENAPHALTFQVTTNIGSACTPQLATCTSASCGCTSQVMLWTAYYLGFLKIILCYLTDFFYIKKCIASSGKYGALAFSGLLFGT